MCGLYESTRELVAGLRGLGVDARIVDPAPMAQFAPAPKEDRGVPIADMDWGVTADLVLSHSGHDGTPLGESQQPILHIQHGRPVSTWLMERGGGAPAYTYMTARAKVSRYRGAVTFWPEYEPILRELWNPKPVYVVPPSVDLEYWAPQLTTYRFAGRKGEYNVVMTDPWSREDTNPILAVHAFALFRRIVPNARLHIYALDGNTKGLQALKAMLGDSLGVVQGWAKDLRSVYAAADMLITPHRIYTRAVREAMAMDLQVVSGRDVHPENIEAFALAMADRMERPQPTRKLAEVLFDPKVTAREFLAVAKAAVERGRTGLHLSGQEASGGH